MERQDAGREEKDVLYVCVGVGGGREVSEGTSEYDDGQDGISEVRYIRYSSFNRRAPYKT